MIYKISPLLILISVSSCTNSYYIQPTHSSVATVSFSNLSDELADIYITTKDKTYLINNKVIENKKPQDKSKLKTKIPADSEVTFKYEYNWLMRERTNITTTYSILNTPSRVNIEKINEANTCSSTVSFTPEEHKHYVVYFGLIADKCIIKAREIKTRGVKLSAE